MKDYYKILNVSKNATQEEIKASYRTLAKKYHPDLYINNPLADLAAEKLKEINEAYAILSDQNKRENYDRGYSGNADNYQNKSSNNIGEQSFFENFVNECEYLIENKNWYALHQKCNEAKSKYPKNSLPYVFEMQAYYTEGNLNAAIEAAKKSMMLNKKDFNVLLFIGKCYIDMKQYNEALSYSLEANQMCDGKNADILAQIALIYDLKGDKLTFNSYMDKLKKIEPNHEFINARKSVFKVGNNYVNKKDAAVDACLLCGLLECIFDCF